MIKIENSRATMSGTPHELVNDWMCVTHELIEAITNNTPFKREAIVDVLSKAFKDACLTVDEIRAKMAEEFKEAVEESEIDPEKACELLEMVAEKIKNGEAEIKTVKREVK